MKTETIYICEHCGLVFDNYEECCAHEMKESAKQLEGVKFFDDNGNQLALNVDPRKIYYFEMSAASADAVDKYFDKCGFLPPSCDVNTSFGGQFYWDNDEWRNVDELRSKLAEIETMFKRKE